jgi:hypothetical protein
MPPRSTRIQPTEGCNHLCDSAYDRVDLTLVLLPAISWLEAAWTLAPNDVPVEVAAKVVPLPLQCLVSRHLNGYERYAAWWVKSNRMLRTVLHC